MSTTEPLSGMGELKDFTIEKVINLAGFWVTSALRHCFVNRVCINSIDLRDLACSQSCFAIEHIEHCRVCKCVHLLSRERLIGTDPGRTQARNPTFHVVLMWKDSIDQNIVLQEKHCSSANIIRKIS